MRHPRRVLTAAPPISLHSQSVFIHGKGKIPHGLITHPHAALSFLRPTRQTHDVLRQSQSIRSFMSKKEGDLLPRKQIVAAYVHTLRNFKGILDLTGRMYPHPLQAKPMCSPGVPPSYPPSPSVSIAARRLASLQSPLSFDAYREPLPVLSIKTPLPNLISPSKFSSPFTPVNQVLHTPFHPPEPHRATPSKRRRNRNWQWSPPHPGIDENSSPARYPDTPDSPVCDLTKRFSLIALPASSQHVPRRLSYSRVCASPCTPESRHGQALASPVLIRSSLWPSSPVMSPCYQLDDLQFSPFHVIF
ncbi:hypothetical protein B0H19DRAFT_1165254 [Mycena capillaripes]|nr:hypothetical protein B0H19DRAFT_1165254 [Mycena capillaripes]